MKQSRLNRFLLGLTLVCGMLLSGVYTLSAQPLQVTGKVLDQSGAPIIGANVVVANSNVGTSTNIDGEYSLNVQKGEMLEFSYLGMATQTVAAQNTVLNITLKEDSTMLDAAVAIGYGTAKKRDLTGSIASVSGESIANRPNSNPMASLQGKVAGVQIVNSGRAGQDPEIRVRGTNSINGYAPLYVVDGIFMDNIGFLNSSDIETFEILKDPSSLAIFGVRGANGVIIVTTKRAKTGQMLVNINTSLGFKHVGQRVSLTDGDQFRELYNEQLVNQGAKPFDYTYYSANTDWQDEIFRTAVVSTSNASIMGATENNKFYLGIGYTYEQGSIRSEELQRVTVHFSDDYTAKRWLRFGVQTNASYTLPADAKDVTGAIHAAPISPVKDAATGTYYAMPDFQRAQVGNPMYYINERGQHNVAQNYRGMISGYGEVDFIPNLKFRAAFSADYISNNSREYVPYRYQYLPETGVVENPGNTESISQNKNNTFSAQGDYTLTYNNTWSERHNLTLMAGMSTNFTEFQSLTAGRSQNIADADIKIPNNDDKWWISSIGDASTATNSGSQYRRFTMSYLARGLYNYDNRYLFNASYRRDGASVFHKTGHTWDNFYSFGAGWVVTGEQFMKNQSVIDYFKIKGSYGVLGNQNTGSTGGYYPAYATLSASNAVFGDKIISSYQQAYLVSDLRWEKTYAWEVGFEMNLFNSRLRIEPVYYNKKTTDLIVYLEKFMGAQDGLTNSGDIRNSGFELSGSWSDKIGDFRYSVSGNLTTIKNKVVSLGKTLYQGPNSACVTEAGKPIGYFYGYVVEGVYQNAADILKSPTNTLASVAPGDLKFKDTDGSGDITAADRVQIGNPTPDFTYGYNISLGWRGIDLNIDFQGVYGNEILCTGYSSSYAQVNYLTKRMGRWHGEGTSNWEPILDSSRSIQQLISTYNIEDGSYLRLRNIQLGYNFSEKICRKIRLKSLRVYANIDNLHTWGHNVGYTPEIGGSALVFGVDSGATYPMPTTYTFGINVSF